MELVLRLKVAGQQDVTAALQQLNASAQQTGAKLLPINTGQIKMGESARASARALGNLSAIMSGATAIASVLARGNKDLQDQFEKATVAMTLTSAGFRALSGTIRLVELAMKMLGSATAIGLVITAVAALAFGLKILIDHMRGTEEAAHKLKTAHEDLEKSIRKVQDATADINAVYGDYDTRIKTAITQSFKFADSLYAIKLQTQGLLGEQKQPITFIDPEADAKAAKEAQDKIKKLREEIVSMGEAVKKLPNYFQDVSGHVDQTFPGLRRIDDVLDEIRPKTQQFAEGFKTGLDDINIGLTETDARITTLGIDIGNIWEQSKAWTDGFKTGLDDMNIGLDETSPYFTKFSQTGKFAFDEINEASKRAFGDILKGTATAADFFTAIWNAALDAFIDKLWEAIGVQQLLNSISGFLGGIFGGILGIFGIKLQHGGSFVTQGPTPLMVGEGGERELVNVTPLSQLGRGSGGNTYNLTVHWSTLTTPTDIERQRLARMLMKDIRFEGGRI